MEGYGDPCTICGSEGHHVAGHRPHVALGELPLLPASTPLVQRGRLNDGKMYVLSGEMFEDRRRRVIVPSSTPDGTIQEAIAFMEESENKAERVRDIFRRWAAWGER
jgi:hypothetical protein